VILPLLLLAVNLDSLVQTGYDHFYNVEYRQAIASFQQAVTAAPQVAEYRNHLAQAVLFELMFRAGALETEMVTGGNPFIRRPKMQPTAEEERLFFGSINESLRLATLALQKNPNDVKALYAQGVALGLRGTYNYLVRKAWLDALKDVTNGRKLHNRVVELDPSNIDARMMQGMHDYVVGSLPWTYRMLGFLVGFHGDKEAGKRAVALVAEKGHENKVDAEILLGIVARRERRPQDAIRVCEDLRRRFPRNFLILFELSQMYADLGDKQKALEALDRVDALKRAGSPGFAALPAERIEVARGSHPAPAARDVERAGAGSKRRRHGVAAAGAVPGSEGAPPGGCVGLSGGGALLAGVGGSQVGSPVAGAAVHMGRETRHFKLERGLYCDPWE
jgi:tetratricopeptide (TPR) repeat protein